MSRIRPTISLSLAALLAAFSAGAGAQTPDIKASSLIKQLQSKYPAAQFKEARPTPVANLFEVVTTRGQIGYVDGAGRYAVFGSMYDMEKNVDMGAKRKAELAPKAAWNELPLDKSITIVKGNGSRRIAVFTDPDCPYCKQLEESLAQIDNLTIHVFLMPIAQLHPEAVVKSESVWCSPDRALAWQRLITEGSVPEARCKTPLTDIAALARKLEIYGTPGIILPNGRIQKGYLPAKQLALALES